MAPDMWSWLVICWVGLGAVVGGLIVVGMVSQYYREAISALSAGRQRTDGLPSS